MVIAKYTFKCEYNIYALKHSQYHWNSHVFETFVTKYKFVKIVNLSRLNGVYILIPNLHYNSASNAHLCK